MQTFRFKTINRVGIAEKSNNCWLQEDSIIFDQMVFRIFESTEDPLNYSRNDDGLPPPPPFQLEQHHFFGQIKNGNLATARQAKPSYDKFPSWNIRIAQRVQHTAVHAYSAVDKTRSARLPYRNRTLSRPSIDEKFSWGHSPAVLSTITHQQRNFHLLVSSPCYNEDWRFFFFFSGGGKVSPIGSILGVSFFYLWVRGDRCFNYNFHNHS